MDKKNKTQFLAKPFKKRGYYIEDDVRVHETANDCWITFFNEVYDITSLI